MARSRHHRHAIVLLVQYPRDPRPANPAATGSSARRRSAPRVLAAQTAVLLSTYLRLLGHEARAHSATCSDVDLNQLAVAGGLALPDLSNPYVGTALRPGGSEHHAARWPPTAPLAEPHDRAALALARAGLVAGLRQRRRARFDREPYRRTRVPPRRLCPSRRCRAATRPPPSSTMSACRASPSAPTSSPARCSAIWARTCRTAPRTPTT